METDRIKAGHVNVSQEIRDDPKWAVRVLLETGALVRFADCGTCAGRDACLYPSSDITRCVPVYRLREASEEPTSG